MKFENVTLDEVKSQVTDEINDIEFTFPNKKDNNTEFEIIGYFINEGFRIYELYATDETKKFYICKMRQQKEQED